MQAHRLVALLPLPLPHHELETHPYHSLSISDLSPRDYTPDSIRRPTQARTNQEPVEGAKTIRAGKMGNTTSAVLDNIVQGSNCALSPHKPCVP